MSAPGEAPPIETEYRIMPRTPEHYHQEADRCRRMAQDILERETKANLLDVAVQYDRLADQAAAKL